MHDVAFIAPMHDYLKLKSQRRSTNKILTFSLALNCFEDAHMHLPQFWRNSTYVPLIVGNLKSSTCSMMFLPMMPYLVFGRTQIFSGRKDNHDPRRFPMQQKLGLWYFLPERLEWETLQKALPWLGLIMSQPAYIMQFHTWGGDPGIPKIYFSMGRETLMVRCSNADQ